MGGSVVSSVVVGVDVVGLVVVVADRRVVEVVELLVVVVGPDACVVEVVGPALVDVTEVEVVDTAEVVVVGGRVVDVVEVVLVDVLVDDDGVDGLLVVVELLDVVVVGDGAAGERGSVARLGGWHVGQMLGFWIVCSRSTAKATQPTWPLVATTRPEPFRRSFAPVPAAFRVRS